MKARIIYKRWKSALQSEKWPISYYNFWDGQTADQIWFTDFVVSHGFFEKYPKAEFTFFSTLGDVDLIKVDALMHPFDRNRKRIFFTGENVHYDAFHNYAQNMLNYPQIELSLGFDQVEDERYLRFPIWLLEMFPANSSQEDVKRICEKLSHQKYDEQRNRFCALVAGGGSGLLSEHLVMRKSIVDSLNTVSTVDCAGRFLRNTEDLQTVFHDNKAEFLKRYKFFICPENISVDGYVTEKVFHSIGSGCIPIYNGSLNNPEPDVLNHDAILFWKKDEDNSQLIKKVEELWNSPKLYKEFFEQPRLQPDAGEVVWQYFVDLENKINNLFG